MLSRSPSPLHALETNSEDLAAPLRARLAALCRDPGGHGKFLNTLSLLEHIGSRKIMKSLPEDGFAHEALKHLSEETRHAFFFKRAAEDLAGRTLDYGANDTLAGASARGYMGRLDGGIARALGPAKTALSYLYMSLIVELRAIWFYRLYDDVLRESKARLKLSSILAEEALHLDAMLAQIRARDGHADARMTAFAALEDLLFRKFWCAVAAAAG